MTTPPAVIVTPYEPRKPRRSRRYASSHWRARLAALLDRISNWLNPLPKSEKSTP